MGVSRSEGYRRGAPKEEEGLAYLQRFLLDVVGLDSERIEGAHNRIEGDVRVSSGASLEVKRQPIDPFKYVNNFVELFEGVSKAHHEGGFAAVAEALGTTIEDLSMCRLTKRKAQIGTVGLLSHASCSIESFLKARAVAYVNPSGHDGYISIYPSASLLSLCWDSARRHGLLLGAGNSNEVTYAVMVPYSELTFSCYFKDESMLTDECSAIGRTKVPPLSERLNKLRALLA